MKMNKESALLEKKMNIRQNNYKFSLMKYEKDNKSISISEQIKPLSIEIKCKKVRFHNTESSKVYLDEITMNKYLSQRKDDKHT